jgi:hypothetical protein
MTPVTILNGAYFTDMFVFVRNRRYASQSLSSTASTYRDLSVRNRALLQDWSHRNPSTLHALLAEKPRGVQQRVEEH